MTENRIIQLGKNKRLIYIPFHQLLNDYSPIPPYIQRALKEERVDQLFGVLMDYYSEYGYVHDLNSIHIAKYNDEYLILDGQHRFNAYKKFFEQPDSFFTKKEDKDFNVLITLYDCEEEGEYGKIFDELNTNYVSTTPLVLSENDKKRKEELVKFFDTNYKKYFESVSLIPRFPNVNQDELINDLLETYPSYKSSEIVNKFLQLNKMIGEDLKTSFPEKYLKIKNKIDGIKKYEGKELFYVYKMHSENESEKTYRKKVPKTVKDMLWDGVFGDTMIGNCYVCSKVIKFTHFEASHIVSVANGGSDSIHNLRCCCGSCNRSMGTKNLEDFKKKYFEIV